MASTYPTTLDQFPPDLIQAVAQDAARDADRVCLFLDTLFQAVCGGRPSGPLRLSAEFLMELAAALRLLTWEAEGIHVHREAGLPSADEALRGAFCLLQHQATGQACNAPAPLRLRVLGLFVERFAWGATTVLGADLLLGDVEEDLLAETLARFLWDNRHAAPRRSTAEEDRP